MLRPPAAERDSDGGLKTRGAGAASVLTHLLWKTKSERNSVESVWPRLTSGNDADITRSVRIRGRSGGPGGAGEHVCRFMMMDVLLKRAFSSYTSAAALRLT